MGQNVMGQNVMSHPSRMTNPVMEQQALATSNTFNESTRDTELKELNEMVKNLLSEQQALKNKLN